MAETMIPASDVATMIAAAAERARHAQRAEEDAQRGPKPAPHPMPTKEEAWQAFAHVKADREEPLDREEFERWWRNEA